MTPDPFRFAVKHCFSCYGDVKEEEEEERGGGAGGGESPPPHTDTHYPLTGCAVT